MSKKLINNDVISPIVKNPPTIADFKINDEMIILSKKIDDIISKNMQNKDKLFKKANFIEKQYLWAIEDLEASLAKKIIKIDAKQKMLLKKIDPEFITQAHQVRKNADLDLIKGKNNVLIDRIKISNSNSEIKTKKIEALLKGQILEFGKIEKGYENLIKSAMNAQDLSESKTIRANHDRVVSVLRNEIEVKRQQLLKLDAQTAQTRIRQAQNLRNEYKAILLTDENVTSTQVEIYSLYMSSQWEAKRSVMNFEKQVDMLSKNKSRAHVRAVNKAEIENKKFGDLVITRTKPVTNEDAFNLKKSRLQFINEGIKNNTNSFKQYVDEKMLVDLSPSYHTYRINPLLLPNNTFKSHKRNGLYKGIKFTLPLIGVVIAIFLMVLYTLFSYTTVSSWIDTGSSSFKLIGSEIDPQVKIFIQNATKGFDELYRIWGLNNSHIWNALFWFGILIIIFSTLSITIRSNTLWSYFSISSLFVFLSIGFGLMLSVIINMGFGDTLKGETTLTMTLFRQLIGQVEVAGVILPDSSEWNIEYQNSFNKLIISLGGTPISFLN